MRYKLLVHYISNQQIIFTYIYSISHVHSLSVCITGHRCFVWYMYYILIFANINFSSFKINCPAEIYVSADRKKDKLVILKAETEHNHDVSRYASPLLSSPLLSEPNLSEPNRTEPNLVTAILPLIFLLLI